MFRRYVHISHFNRLAVSCLCCRPPSFLYFHHLGLGCVCCQHVCVCVCFTFVDKPDVSVTGIKSDTIHVTMMMMFKSIRWRLDIVIGSSSCTDTTSKTDYSIIHLQIIRFLHDRVTPTLYETRRFITVFTKVTTCLH
jgi:hypothetical protein